jgi:hypothetical protein
LQTVGNLPFAKFSAIFYSKNIAANVKLCNFPELSDTKMETNVEILFVLFQVQLHPSILPADFDITPTGELVLNLPNVNQGYQNGFEPETTTADGNGSAIVTGSADIINGQGSPQQSALDNAAFHKAVSLIFFCLSNT